MVSTLEVVVAAFVAQLLVLPGEKVQFIIAGLSTRYDPLTVVAAAGSAFAGWTALEIAFGEALTRVLPELVLDLATAGMFLLFAALLVRSAPPAGGGLAGRRGPTGGNPRADANDHRTEAGAERAPATADDPGAEDSDPGAEDSDPGAEDSDPGAEDGTDRAPASDSGAAAEALDVSVLGYSVPAPANGFVPIFALMAVGEFGDKTQLVTITLAARFGAHPGIWVGEMLAIVPVSLANAYLFHRFAGRFDRRRAHLVGAAVFLFFGLDTLLAAGAGLSVWETAVRTVSEVVMAALRAG